MARRNGRHHAAHETTRTTRRSLFAAAALLAATGVAAAPAAADAATTSAAHKADTSKRAAIVKLAHKELGKRYSYGSAGPNSFDCSGLAQYVYGHAAHISLPHSAQGDYDRAHHIPASHVRAGDLVFFHSGGSVYHVAISLGAGKGMIGAATTQTGVVVQHVWPGAVVSYGSMTHT